MVNFVLLTLNSYYIMSQSIADLRKEYTLNGLSIEDVSENPLAQFRVWFKEALDSGIPEPNAMHISTVDARHRPSSRIVLLKELDSSGFVFYTNYHSKKGQDVAANPYASLTFFWVDLERQVRIEGRVEKVSEQESDDYFAIRPRGSQIGAWVSNQSETLQTRELLDKKQAELEKKFDGLAVPRPPHWGGYRVIPDLVEFWQGRPSRLHDRILYKLNEADNSWSISRLSP